MYINTYTSTHMHINKVKKNIKNIKENNILSRKRINNKQGAF